jgi:hypothetical protein
VSSGCARACPVDIALEALVEWGFLLGAFSFLTDLIPQAPMCGGLTEVPFHVVGLFPPVSFQKNGGVEPDCGFLAVRVTVPSEL